MEAFSLQNTTAQNEELMFELIYVTDSTEVARKKLLNIFNTALNNDVFQMDNLKGFSVLQSVVSDIVEEMLFNKGIKLPLMKLHTHNLYTFYHSIKVSILSMAIAYNLNYTKEELLELGLSGLLHDIGKANVPLSVLDKPGKLNDFEWALMKKHTISSVPFIENHGLSKNIIDGIRDHHERIDGTGYPNNLKDTEISEFGRIIALADVYDALTSDRAYKKGLLAQEGLKIIAELKGKQFDINITENFLNSVIQINKCSFIRLCKR